MRRESALKPRKQPLQRRSRATVEAILQAAAQVFSQYGYTEGTTDKVAARAGVSIGSLYQYFPNKDSLLIALARHHMDEAFGVLGDLLEDEGTNSSGLHEMVRRFVNAIMQLHEGAPQLHRVLFNEAPLPLDFLQEKETRERQFSDQLLTALSRYPEVTVEAPSHAAYMVVQVAEGMIHSFVLFPPEKITATEMVNELVDMLYLYLTSAN